MDVARAPKSRVWRRAAYGGTAALLVAGAIFAVRAVGAAAPAVDRATVWLDTVHRGPMLRDVQGQGTLVPEEIRWITSKVGARVERVVVRPGALVEADTLLLELLNTDVELASLEADRQQSQAEAELANLQATLSAQRLAQESVVATLRSELGDARRRAQADEELAKKGFLSELERAKTHDRADELGGRISFEEKRLTAQSQGIAAQLAAQQAQIERLRSIAQFRKSELDGLKVRAGAAGVLQELPLQPGQTVAAGTMLAKVARPDRLKAEVRIPETQAKDLQIGQKATIDTHNGLISGNVSRIDPASQGGTVRVDVALEGALPQGARPDLAVEGTIELERLNNVLYVGRPAFGQPNSTVGLFKLDREGTTAVRTSVKLGKSSVKAVEIVGGLEETDRVVLSDMSQWDHVDRIRLR
jgi:multidrug resistance efflux pump